MVSFFLFYKFIHCVHQAGENLGLFVVIIAVQRFQHTFLDMLGQDDLSQIIESGADSSDLDQHLRAVPVCLNHGFNGIGMADDPGHPVHQPGVLLR